MPQVNNLLKLKMYGYGDRIFVQAQQIWLILIAHVFSKKMLAEKCKDHQPENPTITYGEVSMRMGHPEKRAAITTIRPLKIIGRFCEINGIPPLDCIVVSDETGVPGGNLWTNEDLDELQKSVMEYPEWFFIRPPTTGALRNVWESMSNK